MAYSKPRKTGRVPIETVLRLSKGGTHGDAKKARNKNACRGSSRGEW